MPTIDELQAKLDELRTEAQSLPGRINAAIKAGIDSAALAELIARRESLPVIMALTEAEILEAQVIAWESELPSAKAAAALARDRAIAAHNTVVQAQKAHGLAAREGTRAKGAVDLLARQIADAKDRAFLLRRSAEAGTKQI